jgi:hypothetical protein
VQYSVTQLITDEDGHQKYGKYLLGKIGTPLRIANAGTYLVTRNIGNNTGYLESMMYVNIKEGESKIIPLRQIFVSFDSTVTKARLFVDLDVKSEQDKFLFTDYVSMSTEIVKTRASKVCEDPKNEKECRGYRAFSQADTIEKFAKLWSAHGYEVSQMNFNGEKPVMKPLYQLIMTAEPSEKIPNGFSVQVFPGAFGVEWTFNNDAKAVTKSFVN